MLKVCRERNDEAGIQFWSYALGVLEILGDPGMSDEEDSSVEVEVEGVVVKQSVKKVKRSYWRAPQVEDLCRVMDTAPALEILIFHKAGAKRVPRIRTDHLSHRLPGPGLPRDFYRKEFLDSLMPHEVADLRFADYSFKLFDLAGYDPSMPDNDNRRMEVD
ncbi:hypothetical protein F5050DRAFT_1579315 [Lentinula boryana]|uniref:Uncharacterized protein n=1 Tax=Lentinula boryana TaxID=40481 RepID=A0ABQ8Q1N7_9AGAR|nr:hypothetical protein GGU11DRAFT_683990 [Lentinula aff. detonsa]KAJ3992571.1 hypothetical protein F5050DRAFT_1579315 [Lentinula boryana]